LVFEWRNNPDIIARFVKTQDIATWKKHDIVLKPNEVMGVMQEGKLVNTYTEEKIKSAVGGLGRKLFKSAAKIDERYLFAVGHPFQVRIPFSVKSSDQLDITGVTTIEYQLQLDDVVKLINLFSSRNVPQPTDSGPGVLLTRSAIGDMLYNEFFSRVYQEVLGSIELSQLRSDGNLQTSLAASLDSEMRRTTNEIGLTYRTSHTVFDENAYDEVQKFRGLFNLEKAKGDVNQDAKLLVIDRQYELLGRDIELGAQCNLATSRGENTIELEQARNQIRMDRERAESEFEVRVKEQQQQLAITREEWELEQAAADKELERSIASGDTVAQEREFKHEQQDQRDALVVDQRDKDREDVSDQRDSDRSAKQDMLMKMLDKGDDISDSKIEVMAKLMAEDAETQRHSESEKASERKEMMKQQTAQQFLDRMGDSTGDSTFIQGDHVAGTKVDTGAGTTISGDVNIGHLSGGNPPPPAPSQSPPPPCPTCGNATRFIAEYNRNYCAKCANYV
jgi:hypothetical protein